LPGTQHGLTPKRLKRTPIIDPGDSEVVDILLDKQNRYALALLKDTTGTNLQRYELDGASVSGVSTIASEAAYEYLFLIDYMNQFKHSTLGTVIALQHVGPGIPTLENETLGSFEYAMLFVDSENDGTFDSSPIEGERSFLEAAGLMEFDDYTLAQQAESL
jgi:hypothetical protein